MRSSAVLGSMIPWYYLKLRYDSQAEVPTVAWTENHPLYPGMVRRMLPSNTYNVLMARPILASLDFTQTFVVRTDASSIGLGAILAQIIHGKGTPHCISQLEAKPHQTKIFHEQARSIGS